MTLARSPAPSVARPATAAGGAGLDSESEWATRVSGKTRSRMGTQGSLAQVKVWSEAEMTDQLHTSVSSLLSVITLCWLPMVLYSLRILPCTPFVPWLSFVVVAPDAICASPSHTAAAVIAVIIIAAIMLLLPVAVFIAMLKEFLSESQQSSAFRIRFHWLVGVCERKYWWWPIVIPMLRKAAVVVAVAITPSASFYVTASHDATSYIDPGLAPAVAAANQSGISLAIVALAASACFMLTTYFRPYQDSFVNKLDAFIDVTIIVLLLPMVLPSDVMFYNEPQQQALLFSLAGAFGLCTWYRPPSNSRSLHAHSSPPPLQVPLTLCVCSLHPPRHARQRRAAA